MNSSAVDGIFCISKKPTAHFALWLADIYSNAAKPDNVSGMALAADLAFGHRNIVDDLSKTLYVPFPIILFWFLLPSLLVSEICGKS